MTVQSRLFWLLLVVAFVGVYLFRLRQVPQYYLPENQDVKIIGRISRQPYLKASKQIIYVGPIVVISERFPSFFYGQKIEIVGKFEKKVINAFKTQYFAYYPLIMVVDEVEKKGLLPRLRSRLLVLNKESAGVINRVLGEPQASLLSGILLGTKKEMPLAFYEALQKTGTLHVVVASGQNVVMVAMFLIAVLTWVMSRSKAIWLALLGVIGYILLVGAEPPVVRAGIMAGLGYLAAFFGREREGTITLFLAAIVMMLVSPLILFDLGFQLSVAATAGICWFYPWLKERRLLARLGFFSEAIATTLGAQIMVTPIILANFDRMSALSPLVNGLVIATVPIIMVLGGGVVILGTLLVPLAQVVAWLAWPWLTYFIWVVEIFARIPWSSWEVEGVSGWWIMGYYLVVVYFLAKLHPKKNTRD